jgi:hypothetical protein
MRRREFIRLLGGSAQRGRLERLAAGTDPACHRSLSQLFATPASRGGRLVFRAR